MFRVYVHDMYTSCIRGNTHTYTHKYTRTMYTQDALCVIEIHASDRYTYTNRYNKLIMRWAYSYHIYTNDLIKLIKL